MQAITPTHIIWLKRHLDMYSFNDERALALKDGIMAYDEKKQNRHQAELLYEEFLKLFSNNMFYYGFKKTKQSVTSDKIDAYLVYNKYNALTPIGLMREVRGDIEYPYEKAKSEYEDSFKDCDKELRTVGKGSKKRKFFDAVTWRQKPMLFRAAIAFVMLLVVGIKLFASKNIILDEVKNGGVIGKIIWGIIGVFVLAALISFIGEVIGVIKWTRYERALKWATECLRDFDDEMDERANRSGMVGKDVRDRELVDDWLSNFRVNVDDSEEETEPVVNETLYRSGFIGSRSAVVWKETDKYQVKLVEAAGNDARIIPYADRSFARQKRDFAHKIGSIKKQWKKGASWKKQFGIGAYIVLIMTGVFLFLCVGKIDYCAAVSEGLPRHLFEEEEDNVFRTEAEVAKEEAQVKTADPYAREGFERIGVKEVKASSEKETNGAKNVIDGKTDTCWVEDKDGEGVNESIEFTFDGTKEISYITVCNGSAASGSEYNISSRPRSLRLEFKKDGKTKTMISVDLNDEWKQEETVYELKTPTECDTLKVYIGSVYSGTLNKDTSLAEIGFYGKTGK